MTYRNWTTLTIAALLVGAAIASIASAPATAQGDSSDIALAARGRVTYRVYCTSCHGSQGRGDGKLAGFLTPPPADLTQLTARAEGDEFPADMVLATVDGRTPVKGHGGGDMPAWGDVFQGLEEGSDPESGVQRRIRELTEFLKTIQE